MRIGKLVIAHSKEDSKVWISNQEYSLKLSIFFKFKNGEIYRNSNEEALIHDEYQPVFEKKNIHCLVETNDQNKIIKIIEMPILPQYLRDFYVSQKNEYHNYALAIEKFANFSKALPSYMHQNNESLYYPSNLKKIINKQDTIIELVNSKQKSIISRLINNDHSVFSTTVKQNWRLATGLGNASIYNNGFTFHPLYGIPYLTAQQIKGVLRAYFINTYFSSEDEANKDELFAYLFGSNNKNTEQSGNLQFLDAFTVNNDVRVEADIMATHYNTYYTGVNKPTDKNTISIKNKNIVIFLSIKKGTFQFNYWIKKAKLKKLYTFNTCIITNGVHLDVLIDKNLKEALLDNGIGAKTAVGYGKLK